MILASYLSSGTQKWYCFHQCRPYSFSLPLQQTRPSIPCCTYCFCLVSQHDLRMVLWPLLHPVLQVLLEVWNSLLFAKLSLFHLSCSIYLCSSRSLHLQGHQLCWDKGLREGNKDLRLGWISPDTYSIQGVNAVVTENLVVVMWFILSTLSHSNDSIYHTLPACHISKYIAKDLFSMVTVIGLGSRSETITKSLPPCFHS